MNSFSASIPAEEVFPDLITNPHGVYMKGIRYREGLTQDQLAHTVKDPNGRAYNRTSHLIERKKMMQQWADYLDEIKRD